MMQTVRRLSPLGRLVIGGIIIGCAFLATCTLIMVPSPFGF
jgi:hypothetical protein